jgi:hypothetical protein
MFHALNNIPNEQRDLLEKVTRLAYEAWASLTPFAVVGGQLGR